MLENQAFKQVLVCQGWMTFQLHHIILNALQGVTSNLMDTIVISETHTYIHAHVAIYNMDF